MTTAPSVPTTTDVRSGMRDALAEQLRHRGFVVTPASYGSGFNVGTKDGYLGSLKFWSVYTSSRGPYGYVEFDPQASSSGHGRYRVSPTGTINVDGLVRRLLVEAPKAAAERERRKASAARAKADATISDMLWETLGEDRENDVVDITVFKGLVDIKLVDITPAQAQAVLVALKAVL